MQYIRLAHSKNLLLWLVVITVCLRSLIAPGFMLETNGDGPLGLSIVLCDGITVAAPADPKIDPHALHKHPGSVDADENTSTGMAGETCGLWSTSSTFVQTLVFASDHLVPFGPDEYIVSLDSLIAPLYRQQPQQPRAPPVSLIS